MPEIAFTYDANILKAVNASTTKLTQGFNLTSNLDTSGKVLLALASATGISEGSGSIVDVSFDVKENAKPCDMSELKFEQNLSLFDQAVQPIPFTTQDGKLLISCCTKGDLNGDNKINSGDSIIALRMAVGLMVPDERQKCAGDVNCDGKIGSGDSILILRKAVGIITEFPCSPPQIASLQGELAFQSCITFSLPHIAAFSGKCVTIPLKLTGDVQVAGADLAIRFDPSVLIAKAAQLQSHATNGILIANNNLPGKMTVSFAAASELIVKEEILLELIFDVVENAQRSSELTIEDALAYDNTGTPVPVVASKGYFSAASAVPKFTALFQNYPNPFNPETWIPFTLAQEADVIIRIYDLKGQLVKVLNLEGKAAGFYLNKEKAARWDGTNQHGERVASGVYFYRLEAGNSTARRKLVIVK
ncbi:T9SS type A sorting domain-containing protein [Candidatus Poribacteria bacterium]|nr:T9SS type A sorting domain-containing protein [Candidatus Poribacteria bacterium]